MWPYWFVSYTSRKQPQYQTSGSESTYELMQPNMWVIQCPQEVLTSDPLSPIPASTTFHTSSQPQRHIISRLRSSRTLSIIAILMKESSTARIALRNSLRIDGCIDLLGRRKRLEEGWGGGRPAGDFDGNGRVWPTHEAGELVCPLEDVFLKGRGYGCALRSGEGGLGVPADAEVDGAVDTSSQFWSLRKVHAIHSISPSRQSNSYFPFPGPGFQVMWRRRKQEKRTHWQPSRYHSHNS